jgi:hypothetical protein
MKIYLDMCSLKRPFDDQSQNRIWIETQSVIRILDAYHAAEVKVCNSEVLVFENSLNPNPIRKRRVAGLLSQFGTPVKANAAIYLRAETISKKGFDDIDALHLAFAEKMNAVYFITCDDRILSLAGRGGLFVKVTDPSVFIKESGI